VKDLERFEFTNHRAFDFSNAVSSNGTPTVYVRYSPHTGDFKTVRESRVFGPTNISESGDIVLYRALELTDKQCPSIEKIKTEIHMLSKSGEFGRWSSIEFR
jgi:hypothetical protein